MENLDQKSERENVIVLMNEVISDVCSTYKLILEDGAVIEVNEEMNIVDNFFDVISYVLDETSDDGDNVLYAAHIADGVMLSNGKVSINVDEKYTLIQQYVISKKEDGIYPSEY